MDCRAFMKQNPQHSNITVYGTCTGTEEYDSTMYGGNLVHSISWELRYFRTGTGIPENTCMTESLQSFERLSTFPHRLETRVAPSFSFSISPFFTVNLKLLKLKKNEKASPYGGTKTRK